MITRAYFTPALLGAALLALGGCAASGEPSAGTTVDMQADYPSFDSGELVDQATLIVEGTALATESTVLLPRYDGDTAQENPLLGVSEKDKKKAIKQDQGVAATVVTFHVAVVHKGDVKPGQDVKIVQSGGVVDGVTYRSASDIIMSPGSGYLVFGGDSFDGAFYLLGGSSGSYRADGTGNYQAVSGGAPFKHLTSDDVNTLTSERE